MTIIVCTAGGVFLLWAAWWIYRGTPKHGKHYTTVAPTVAAHHQLPPEGARAFSGSMQKMTDPYQKAGLCQPRHTHRDPTTGRYTRKEQ